MIRISRGRAFSILLVLGGVGAWFFWWQGDRSPEEEIRELLREVQERVADRDVLSLLDHLHPDYRHGDGQSVDQLRPFLLGLVPPVGREKVSLLYRSTRIEEHLDGVELEIWCLLIFANRSVQSLGAEEGPPGRSRAFHVYCKFVQHEGEYKVIRSSGGLIPLKEFLSRDE